MGLPDTLALVSRQRAFRNAGPLPPHPYRYNRYVDLLVSLQGSPGAKVENGGFKCWTSFSVERAQLPVQETETKMGDRERCNEGGDSRIVILLLSTTRYI